MIWLESSLVVLAAVDSVLAILDPTAPATPCVSSRSVSPAVQSVSVERKKKERKSKDYKKKAN
jgi:hypothetical protein